MTLITLFALLAPTAQATPLDLDTVQVFARERSAPVELADLSVQSQQLSTDAAGRAWEPDLGLHTGAGTGIGGANNSGPNLSFSGGLTTSMPLYQGGSLVATKHAADSRLDASKSSRDQAVQDAVWQASDTLLAIGEAQLEVRVQESALTEAEALLAQVQTLVDAGSRTSADLYTQQAQVAQQQASLASARVQLHTQELDLLSLLRLDPTEDWSFVAPTVAPRPAGDLAALVDLALRDRSDLDAIEALTTAAKSDQRAAWGQGLPSISLSAGLSTGFDPFAGTPAGKQLDDALRGTIGVSVGFDLFDRGARHDRNASAALQTQRATLALDTAKEQLAFDVRRLLAAEQAAQASVDATTAQVAAAHQAAEVTRLRYAAGSATLIELSSAQTAAIDADLGLARAESNERRIGYQLAWTTGGL